MTGTKKNSYSHCWLLQQCLAAAAAAIAADHPNRKLTRHDMAFPRLLRLSTGPWEASSLSRQEFSLEQSKPNMSKLQN